MDALSAVMHLSSHERQSYGNSINCTFEYMYALSTVLHYTLFFSLKRRRHRREMADTLKCISRLQSTSALSLSLSLSKVHQLSLAFNTGAPDVIRSTLSTTFLFIGGLQSAAVLESLALSTDVAEATRPSCFERRRQTSGMIDTLK